MAFATEVDVENALGRSLTSAESAAVDNQIDQATDLVVGYLGTAPDPVPGAVTRVVATMVAAVFDKPAITTSDYNATGYNVSREAATVQVGNESATTSGPWLTNALKMRLNPYRIGAVTVFTVSSEFGS
jgi:hypothetical protein